MLGDESACQLNGGFAALEAHNLSIRADALRKQIENALRAAADVDGAVARPDIELIEKEA